LKQFLGEHDIETVIHYPTPLPALPAYRYLGHQPSDFPVATSLQQEILSLPLYPELTEEMIAHVAKTIRSFYEAG
jgi:dTDP-4-amino-4,6-dideoxygalactose transaminase